MQREVDGRWKKEESVTGGICELVYVPRLLRNYLDPGASPGVVIGLSPKYRLLGNETRICTFT